MGENTKFDPPSRVGRPRAEAAGEVEARILDAAALVFWERGFAGASLDLIAETARCGKPTIYARYPDKERLFEAAFLRRLAQRNTRLATLRIEGASVLERLTCAGIALVEETLTPDYLGLLRLAVAEAHRLPHLELVREARERGGRLAARLLAESSGAHESGLAKAGVLFVELVLAPMLLRALTEPDLGALRLEIPAYVAERAAVLLAAIKGGAIG
jgi:AcrR family transcriptional regulator